MVADEPLPSIHDRISILAFLRQHLDADGRVLDSGMRLPRAVEPRPGGFSFAPGALEGILGHHTTPEPPTTDWSVEVAG